MAKRNTSWTQQGDNLFAASEMFSEASSPRASSALVTASHYAVQKRVLVPAWWVIPVACKAMSTDFSLGDYLSADDFVLQGSCLQQKFFHVLASVWNELFKIQGSGMGSLREVEVSLEKILRGTSADLAEQMSALEQHFAGSFRCVKASVATGFLTTTKKQVSDVQSGVQMSAVWRVRSFVDTLPKLVLHFTCSLDDFLSGRFFSDAMQKSFAGLGNVVSLNPDVLRVLSQGRSAKKLSSYVLVEISKRRKLVDSQPGWNGGLVSFSTLSSFHKDLMSRTKSLYDHGVFGWEDWAPSERISEIRKKIAAGCPAGGRILHLFRMSDHALAASRLEDCMSHTNTSAHVKVLSVGSLAPSAERVVSIRSSLAKSVVSSPDISAPEVAHPVCTLSPEIFLEPVVEPVVIEPIVIEPFVLEPECVVVPEPQPILEPILVVEPIAPAAMSGVSFENKRAEISAQPIVERCGAQAAVSSHDDFLIKMMEYFESLPSDEQEVLLREQKRMSKLRFRNYMAQKLGVRLSDLSEQ
jgi:hypothetical protein